MYKKLAFKRAGLSRETYQGIWLEKKLTHMGYKRGIVRYQVSKDFKIELQFSRI